ncbi:MAG: Gmad2 immunoglobulin-like domain-containing protein [Chloroflexi bacterium]|nr:Gmad2 immunoglobulin-like domain-containing protein [Chloroflexota bacterium]
MYLMPFVARHGDLTQVGREFLGDRVRVESVDIADGGLVTVEMIAHGPREPLCCPTQPVTQRFWLRILVDSPQSFAEASLPLRIAGVARTTEGNVRLHIRDARRGVVVDSFTTARMPGVGAFGSFEFVVTDAALASHRNTQVTLELFEESAADGSPVGLASVPIRLR